MENCLRQEWPAAPDALKVMCAKNFSNPAKFGILPEVSEISSGLLRAERWANILYDKTKNEGHRLGQNQRTGCPPICRSYRWLCNLLADLKARVRAAQLQAVLSVNRALIQLYWDIGKIIAEAQKTRGYGKQVV